MTYLPQSRHPKILHWLFDASLVIKGLLCSAETLAGIGLLFAPNALIARLLYWLTHFKIAEKPGDSLAAWTQRAVEQFPIGTQDFYGWYLLAHGGLKLTLVVMLWARIKWAYPVGMAVLGCFVAYQLAEFIHTGSPFLLLLAVFDLFMIGLIWQEYWVLQTRLSSFRMIP